MLPELWERIFDELSGCQLLDVILVCKQFKEIVETSSRLMDKLNLVLRKSRCDENLLRSIRKYKNLIVDGVDENLKVFLRIHSKSIENLKIFNCTITTSDMKQLLDPISNNLRVLSMCNVKLIANTFVKTKTNFPRLQKLHLMTCDDNTCASILKGFCDGNLQEFVYMSDCHVDENQFESLMRFLSLNRKLTSLCLSGDVAGKLMKSEKYVDVARFNLESFWVEFEAKKQEEVRVEAQNLIAFLVKQKPTLKVLNVGNLQIDEKFVNLLSGFNQLTSLRFSNCTFKSHQSYAINGIVKEISLSETDVNLYEKEVSSFLRSMQHAVKLKLSSVKITFDVALTVAYDMQCLIHLTVDKCHLNPFTFANIKRLRFIEVERSAMLRTIQVNRQIEWLEMAKQHQNDPDISNVINKLTLCKTVKFR